MGNGGELLSHLRVLDLSAGDADAVTRLLADLGADVLKVEGPAGSPARAALPSLAGTGIAFAVHNANKRATVLDPTDAADRRRFVELAQGADIVVDSGNPGQAAAYGTSCAELVDRSPHLVALSVSDFGLLGSRSRWRATDPVLYALSSALSRSGPPTGTPVLPPDGIASTTAAVQAAWAALVAYYNRLRCGRGEYIDFSRLEAVVMALDPPFGTQGQAAVARSTPNRWRGRPKNQDAYPILRCADGYVRICVLSPRQWRGLRAWLGEPADFQDPRYDGLGARYADFDRIGALVSDLFIDQTMDALVTAGQAYGVPIAAVLSASDVLSSDHFTAVGAMTQAELAPGVHAAVPVGYYAVDGGHCGFRTAAAPLAHDRPVWVTEAGSAESVSAPASATRPFEGLRIVDLGVIVAGAELSRLFGDLGAEVIKVESAAFPDGLRQTKAGQQMSDSFALAHRNNLGFGLEMRSEQGANVFGRLVSRADAVFANFKPGTLTSLGFSYENLQRLNPAIVLVESSAFGDTGPWSTRMGYGPLVRATTGITKLWTSADAAPEDARHPFYDATTIFPDHVVGRISAIGALAALIHRDRTGAGTRIHVSQAEVAVNQLDIRYVTDGARESLPDQVCDDTAVHAVFPCAGNDEWCVISVRDNADWAALAAAMGRLDIVDDPRWATGAARVVHRGELVGEVSQWTARHSPADIAERAQSAGVPAGAMNRPHDVYVDAQTPPRELFTDLVHPLIDHALPTETGPAHYRHIPPAPLRPAPMPGEHTREICQKTLGMDTEETERLIGDGVLFSADKPG